MKHYEEPSVSFLVLDFKDILTLSDPGEDDIFDVLD